MSDLTVANKSDCRNDTRRNYVRCTHSNTIFNWPYCFESSLESLSTSPRRDKYINYSETYWSGQVMIYLYLKLTTVYRLFTIN